MIGSVSIISFYKEYEEEAWIVKNVLFFYPTLYTSTLKVLHKFETVMEGC